MARKKKVVEKPDVQIVVESDSKIPLMEFLEKNKIGGFLRQAYLKKFSISDRLTEKEWLKK